MAYSLTDNWEPKRQWHQIELCSAPPTQHVTIHVPFQKVHNEFKAIVKSPGLDWSPDKAVQWYKKRFNIETGYRDKHQFQARTSSKSLTIRFLILLFAFIFWNLCQIFFLLVKKGQNSTLKRVARWRREYRTIKVFLLRDMVL